MIEVLRTSDRVRLSYALALLEDAGCRPFCADRFISAAEGSISAFPQRILVPEEEAPRAKTVLRALDEPVDTPTDGDEP